MPIRLALLLLPLAAAPSFSQIYAISTIAGGVPPATPASGVAVSIGQPLGIATDTNGNIYFASGNCIFKMSPTGILTRFAGTSRAGYSGDGGPATNAQLNSPTGIAIDNAGDVYIADYGNHRLREVSPDGLIGTVAGGGGDPYPDGDGIPATSASLFPPLSVAVDGSGTPHFSESGANRVRKVPSTGIIATAAGNGELGYSGDGGAAVSAQISRPYGIAFDPAGNLYIADPIYNVIRKVTPDETIATVAGPSNGVHMAGPTGVVVDAAGNLYIADQDNNRVLKVAAGGAVSIVAGNGVAGFSGDGGPASSAQLNSPRGVAIDLNGNLFIADSLNYRIREVTASGTILTIAGNGYLSYSGDGGPAALAQLNAPQGVAANSSGDVFIADSGNHRIRKISATGIITTVAGNGSPGFSGDNGPAMNAQLNEPAGLAIDTSGNLFIADADNNRIRKIAASSGVITTVAGNGSTAVPPNGIFVPVGDGGQATSAELHRPLGVAVSASGILYIADVWDYAIREVSSNGVISTILAVAATVPNTSKPESVAVDGSGNVFVGRVPGPIAEISPQGVLSSTIYGATVGGNPVAVDGAGNLFFGNCGANIVKLSPMGAQNNIAGSCAAQGYSGDGSPGPDALLSNVVGVAADAAGNVYAIDTGNNAIRLLQPVNQTSLIGAVVSAASEGPGAVSPGEIVLLYGAGLGPTQLTPFQAGTGKVATQIGGASVAFNGTPAPILYTSSTQVAAIVPYEVSGSTAQVTVTYQGQASPPFTVPLAASMPTVFTLNQTGAGQAAAVNVDGTVNSAANPVRIGDYISLYATGEGQTSPDGIDGKIASAPLPYPILPVTVTVGGQPATVTYYGAAPGEVAGLMQVNVQVPSSVQPGGYVPVLLKVGNNVSRPGVTIAVSR